MKRSSLRCIPVLILICAACFVFAACGPGGNTADVGTSGNDYSDVNGTGGQEVFTDEELYSFDLLRHDWSMEQMEEAGFEKTVYDNSGMIFFFNDFVEYMYLDWRSDYPVSVTINGDCEGPRKIRIGDSFEDVLSKFPQEKDWQDSFDGEFYGSASESQEPVGMVYEGLDGYKSITLAENGFPSLEFIFQNDVLTQYTFLLQYQ